MIVGILLAAGASSRFGSRKLLHPLADGVSIGAHSAQNLRAAVDKAIAVVAPGDRALQELLAGTGVDICACPRAHEGMGTSLACGVQASAAAAGWIIALADMPFVRPQTVAALARALRRGAAIAVPVYRGQRGNPVGFCHEYYTALTALAGDAGARAIVTRDRAQVISVPVEDAGIHRDIDAPNDLPP